MSSRPTFIGAVEIGTSKITVLVGEYTGRELAIIGRGECSSRGVIKGAVVDYKAASECTHSALEQAERDAGERIELVFLAQTGGHLEGFYNEAAVNVKASDNMIEPSDIRTVCDLAKSKELPAGRMVVHNIRRPFRVDGRLVPGSPENLVGQRLEVGYWTVHGQEQRLADNIHVIRGFNLEVRELVLSSLASGHMVTTPEERQHGVLAIDIGAGTTDFVLYRDGAPHTTGVVPVGGTHLTNDLSIGLRLTEGQAEKLKLRFGRANVQTRDKSAESLARRQFRDRRPAVSATGDRADHVGARLGVAGGGEEETRQCVFARNLCRGRRAHGRHREACRHRGGGGEGFRRAGASGRGADVGERELARSRIPHGARAALLRSERASGDERRGPPSTGFREREAAFRRRLSRPNLRCFA